MEFKAENDSNDFKMSYCFLSQRLLPKTVSLFYTCWCQWKYCTCS